MNMNYGLEVMRELMTRLNNPQDGLRCIHVAGTNGKGSTVAFLTSILCAAGYKTGAYTSPALRDFKENIRINSLQIAEGDAERILHKIKSAAADMIVKPSQFEEETALAFCYFCEEKVDYAIIECGMGGLLDATNIIKKPALAVITSLGLDHTEILGATIEEIRRHKEGIIKDGCAAVRAEDIAVMRAKFAGVDRQIFDCGDLKDLEIRMGGAYQLSNAALAAEAAKKLGIAREFIYEGLSKAVWAGRFSVVGKNPLFIVDGAHNPQGAAALRQTIDACFNEPVIFVSGIFRDKDAKKMIEALSSAAERFFIIDMPENQRLYRAEELREIAAQYAPAEACLSPADAVNRAIDAAGAQGVVISFGSLSIIDAVTRAVKERL